jgi:hypothetical protein
VLIGGEGKSGVVVVIDAGLKIDASLKTEELVKIAGSSMVLVTEWSKDRGVKELMKIQNVSGVLPSSAN